MVIRPLETSLSLSCVEFQAFKVDSRKMQTSFHLRSDFSHPLGDWDSSLF